MAVVVFPMMLVYIFWGIHSIQRLHNTQLTLIAFLRSYMQLDYYTHDVIGIKLTYIDSPYYEVIRAKTQCECKL